MDLFGVCILGLTTAVGGGILRDLILNITPPAAFQNPVFAVTGVLVSLVIFLPSVRSSYGRREALYRELILLLDSLGLGLFTVVGVQAGMAAMAERNLFLATFVGVLTGVGGGVMRDVLAGNMPSIFVRHFYACAAILGAWACVLLWGVIGELPAMIAGAALTLILRLLAAHYRWSLPKAK